MFTNYFKKFITTMAVSMVTFGVVAPFTQTITTNPTTVHAASTVAADGPWETTGDAANLPEIQAVHNGNEIYYSIKPGDRNTNLFHHAVNDWNALGVINLVEVPWGDTSSEIAMSSAGWSDDDDADSVNGDTNFGYLYYHGNTTATMTNTTIVLYKDMTSLNQMEKEVVADHELGHALGFDHDNRRLHNGRRYRHYHLTMYYTADDAHYYRLGGIEQRALADHYDIAPSDGFLDTNC